jgi:hypothetical protein
MMRVFVSVCNSARKIKKRSLWNLGGIFFKMELNILSGPGVFPFVKFLRHKS